MLSPLAAFALVGGHVGILCHVDYTQCQSYLEVFRCCIVSPFFWCTTLPKLLQGDLQSLELFWAVQSHDTKLKPRVVELDNGQ